MAKTMICEILENLEDLFGCSKRQNRLQFTTIKTEDGFEITGKIKMVKFEFEQYVDFSASAVDRRGRPASIEPGSAVWSFTGTDADGNDASGAVTIAVDPLNELSARVTSGTTEVTGTLKLEADGDPDAGEYFPLVAAVAIVVDASNAVAFSLSNTEPADV
jgi:hypothetical protein